MRQGSSFFFSPPHRPTQPSMATRVVAPSLLAVGGSVAALTTPFPSKKVARLLVSKRSRISARLGGGGDGEAKSDGEKKFITREEEPEQYWQTAGERKGENPMMTPLPYIVIFGFSTPFIILAIAFANGWIKAPLIR